MKRSSILLNYCIKQNVEKKLTFALANDLYSSVGLLMTGKCCCLAGKLYGRGSTDDKGPVLAWFNVIEAFQKIGQVLTFNITFIKGFMS